MSEDFFSHYKHKILNLSKLEELALLTKRKFTLVHCHGTFDLVHPGHIRHLHHAKKYGDKLLVSITSDRFIDKANYRPYVPEALRAINLAALEMVDYVVIDEDPEPIALISLLKPEVFAKGDDYNLTDLSPKTQKEHDAVSLYGGKIVFTPGDIVYSSSKLITNNPPDLSLLKLQNLLKAERISLLELHEDISKFSTKKVTVVGDTIIDRYTNCTPLGFATSKSPTISLREDEVENYLGGAGIVAAHIAATGAKVALLSVVGEDEEAIFAKERLSEYKIEGSLFVDSSRPTTLKNNYLSLKHRLLKVDRVDNRRIDEIYVEKISDALKESDPNITIFSDFRHGIFSKNSILKYEKSIPQKSLKVADSQVASRWGNILDFLDYDLITPNEKEVRFSLGDQDTVIRPLAAELFRRANCRVLILKLGERGSMTFRGSEERARDFFQIDSLAETVNDPVGAGDALLAYASLGLEVTESPLKSALLGTIAAGIACEKSGNIPITLDEVRERINRLNSQLSQL